VASGTTRKERLALLNLENDDPGIIGKPLNILYTQQYDE
jgi:hypothetical protein